jgi:hypothetical protein
MKRYGLCFLMIFPICSVYSEMRTCASLKDFFGNIELQEGDLVVCDIDGTLLACREPAIDGALVQQYWEALTQLTEWTPLLKEVVGNLTTRCPMMLIEPEIPKVIANIQRQEISVVALTACQTFPCGDKETPRFRFEQLRDMGMHLSDPLHQEEMIEFEELDRVMGYFPSYYHGVIVSNSWFFYPAEVNEKGSVLRSFIHRLPERPKRVIFCDDVQRNLNSVEYALTEMGIAFEGCYYVGGDGLKQQIVSVERFQEVWSALIYKARKLIATTPSLFEENMCMEPFQ